MAYQETVLSSPEGSQELWWSPPNLLLSTLLVAAVLPIGAAAATLPSPRSTPTSLGLRTWLQARPSFYTEPASQATTQQTTWVFTPRQAPPWSAPNLLVSSLAQVSAAPFTQSEWLTPIGKVYGPPELRTWLETRKTYYVEPAIVFNQSDWPNPPQAKASSAPGLKTWLQTLKTYYTETIPIAQTDWPNPLARPALSTLTRLLQSKPTYYVDAVTTSSAVTQQSTLLIGRRPSPIWEPPNLLTSSLSPVSAAAPFNQLDWLNPPLAKASPISQRTFVFYYVYDDSSPFTPQEWPNPQPRPEPRGLRTWLQGFSLLNQPVPVKPFLQSMWPLPTGKPYPQTLRTWVDWRALVLTDPTPFVLTDWPLPTGKQLPISLRTWLDWRELGLVDQVPAHLTDWPNPTGKPYPVFLRTFTAGQWNTIGPLVIQVFAAADLVVVCQADDLVVVCPADDYTVRI